MNAAIADLVPLAEQTAQIEFQVLKHGVDALSPTSFLYWPRRR
jgi:hypothetical protein